MYYLVESSKQLKWDTIGKVTTSKTAIWDTKKSVEAAAIVKWNVLTSVSKGLDIDWSVIQSVNSSKNIYWNVGRDIVEEVLLELFVTKLHNLNMSVNNINGLYLVVDKTIEIEQVINKELELYIRKDTFNFGE